jgi:radical SAM protein with 4Fe4S-binding SPASM domain
MDMSVLDTILDQAKEYCLSSIGLNWLGEPTLAKDLELRIQKCVNAGIMDVLMSTNGMLIDELLSKQIIQAGLTHMLFSIDAASEETYELIRLNGDFKRVNRNIETFIKVRNQITGNVHPLTRASLVPSKLNQKEIGKFVEKYSKIVDYVEIQPFFNNFFRLNDLVADKAKKVSFKCKEVFTKLNIDSNGDVHPCCSIYGRDIILGNIKNDDLKDIFTTNPILVMLRKEISKNIYSLEQCKLCQQSMYRLNINDSHTKNSTELPVLS